MQRKKLSNTVGAENRRQEFGGEDAFYRQINFFFGRGETQNPEKTKAAACTSENTAKDRPFLLTFYIQIGRVTFAVPFSVRGYATVKTTLQAGHPLQD